MSENVANKSVFSIAKLVVLVPLPPKKCGNIFVMLLSNTCVTVFNDVFVVLETKKHHLQNSSSIINFPVFFTKCSSKLFNAIADENSASAIRNLWQMVLKAIWILARWRLAASGLCCNNSSTLNVHDIQPSPDDHNVTAFMRIAKGVIDTYYQYFTRCNTRSNPRDKSLLINRYSTKKSYSVGFINFFWLLSKKRGEWYMAYDIQLTHLIQRIHKCNTCVDIWFSF